MILFFLLGGRFIFQNEGSVKCPEKFNTFVEYRLFLGRNNSQGEEIVSDKDWTLFVENTVTPLFPDGLTIYEARGHWLNSSGHLTQEKSKVIHILVNSPNQESIDKLITTYKNRFQQKSVLSLTSPVCAVF